jgi:hypothetical protein
VEKKEKTLRSEDFFTNWPLYTPFEMEHFERPARISFHCGACGKETTWAISQSNFAGNPGFSWVQYQCTLCERQHLTITYLTSILGTSEPFVSRLQKIGQYPPLSIDIPKTLRKNLGEAATSLYKKALINRNQGYGLGAVTYIRRVVDDKTDELIEVVAQLAESHNIESKIVEKIRAAKVERTTFENKLKIAATVLPTSLMPSGLNPLGELYRLVSEGIHGLSEEECIAVADETQSVFEFTFTHLRAETEERKSFVTKVTKWAGGKTTAEKNLEPEA